MQTCRGFRLVSCNSWPDHVGLMEATAGRALSGGIAFCLPLLALLLSGLPVLAEQNAPPPKKELAAITERGRRLADYDAASRHATDSILAAPMDLSKKFLYLG